MPAVIGENGVEQILPLPLNDQEHEKLTASANALRQVIETNKL